MCSVVQLYVHCCSLSTLLGKSLSTTRERGIHISRERERERELLYIIYYGINYIICNVKLICTVLLIKKISTVRLRK